MRDFNPYNQTDIRRATNNIETYHRAYITHRHTFNQEWSSENLFWLLVGGVFKLLLYIPVRVLAFIITGVVRLIFGNKK